LQWLLPIRVEDKDPYYKGALFILLCIYPNRFPHLLPGVAPDTLTHCYRKGVGTNAKSVFIRCLATDLEPFVMLNREDRRLNAHL